MEKKTPKKSKGYFFNSVSAAPKHMVFLGGHETNCAEVSAPGAGQFAAHGMFPQVLKAGNGLYHPGFTQLHTIDC